jgi:lipopolysaccharide transport system permease protein
VEASLVILEIARPIKSNAIRRTPINSHYHHLIRPTKGWASFDLRGLFAYRDLLWQLVYRDYTARFKQTILGPLWFIINPLITTVLFAIIFGRLLGASPAGVPPLLFYNAGLLAWNYFSNLLSATGNTLQGNVHLFSKVYFPRLVVPIAQAFSNLIGLAVGVFTFGILLIYVWFTDAEIETLKFGWGILFIPFLLLHIAILALGAGLLISALTARYRDLQNVLAFVINSLMLATPVMWPISSLQQKFPLHYEVLMLANPMISIVEGFRLALIGVGSFEPVYYAFSVLSSLVLFLVGIVMFQRAARSFVDQA